MFATKDIVSNNRAIYAKQGDFVEIINKDHGDVYLCKNKDGVTFPAHKSKLSDHPVGERPAEIIEKPVKQSRKALTQAEKIQLEYLSKK